MAKQREILKTGKQRWTERCIHTDLTESTKEGTQLCLALRESFKVNWSQISEFLQRNFPLHHAQLCNDMDEDGFIKIGSKKGNLFDYWVRCKDLQHQKAFRDFGGVSLRVIEEREPQNLEELSMPSSNLWTFTKEERMILLESLGRFNATGVGRLSGRQGSGT